MALKETGRSKALLRNRIPEDDEKAIVAWWIERPEQGKARAGNELGNRGLSISPAEVRCRLHPNGISSAKAGTAPYSRSMNRLNTR